MGGIIGAVTGEIFGVMLVRRINRQQKQRREQIVAPTAEPFVVSEYLARIERVALDIEQEKREKAPTVIVLWLLLDGLQINADGSFEWIKRERDLAGEGGRGGHVTSKFVPLSTFYSLPQSVYPPYPPTYLPIYYGNPCNVAQSLALSRAVMLSQLCDARANLEAQRINALSALNTCTITQ